MPAVPPAEANRARIMPRRVADANVRGGAGTVHAGAGAHARYVDIGMPPTNASNAWPPPDTPARNTWPEDALAEYEVGTILNGEIATLQNMPEIQEAI